MGSFLLEEDADPASDMAFAGIPNAGNTCYISAWIQALRPTGAHQDACARAGISAGEEGGPESKLVAALCAVVAWPTEARAERLAVELSIAEPRFQLHTQSDAMEFGQVAIQYLHAQSSYSRLRPWQSDSPIAEKLRGALERATRCESCQYVSVQAEAIWELACPVPNRRRVELADCIAKALAPQRVRDWICPNCKAVSESIQETRLLNAPDFLVVRLLRFDHKGRKTYTKILDSKKIILESIVCYRVVACVVHSGSTTEGHYTANVKHKEKTHHFDDAIVSAMKDKDMLSLGGDPYIIVLEKQKIC